LGLGSVILRPFVPKVNGKDPGKDPGQDFHLGLENARVGSRRSSFEAS
jgi:hypothetical protein